MIEDSVEKWRRLRNELHGLFRERQLTFAKAAERYELTLHEDDFDYEFNYERVKKFWKKPPKSDSPSALEKDCPDKSRLSLAIDYLTNLRNYLLDDGTVVVGKKNCISKRLIIKDYGVDFWAEAQKAVINRVEKEEADEEWGR
ncbi:MAG: hypothetical protein MJY85_03195 [Fibrobacter sp.]|nr:hypothetical protein [Fibrobacter sp.]